MSRAPRGPKRSPTPTQFPPEGGNAPTATPGDGNAPKPLYLCSPFVEAALVKGNFKTIVMLPKYVEIYEWVAVNSAPFLLPPFYLPSHNFFLAYRYSV
jgi:MOB kinase activator 1